MSTQNEIEKIIGVAVLADNGTVYADRNYKLRHPDIIRFIHELGLQPTEMEGFITSNDRVVGRKEAFVIANSADQIVNALPVLKEELYSEHLF